METKYNLSDSTKQVLHISKQIAVENMHGEFGAPHLLKALLHKDFGIFKFLESKDVDVYYIDEWAEIRVEQYPRATKPTTTPTEDKLVDALFNEAEHLQRKLNYGAIEPECLLMSLATPGVAFSYDQLKTFTLTTPQIYEWYNTNYTQKEMNNGSSSSNITKPRSAGANQNTLKKYCIDKIDQANKGLLNTVIGRNNELRKISEIISRKSKSNVIVVGEAGVGKTALLDGFAQAIATGNVPKHLQHAAVFQIDNGAIIAGAAYKGEIEDRINKIISEISTLEKPILFIDEIHTFVDKNNPTGGAAGILKAELGKGILTVVATTTNDEYRKSIEKDETFSRRFEIIKLNEPDTEIAERMLRNQAQYFEEHHQLKINDLVFGEAIRLAKRFIKDRQLPDSALDLLDRTMAVYRMMAATSQQDVQLLQQQLQELGEEPTEAQLRWLYHETQSGLSATLLARHNEEKDFGQLTSIIEQKSYLQTLLQGLERIAENTLHEVEVTDLSAVVANITGIPIGKIQTKEQERLINMENHLRQRVIGQDHALKSVTDAILESRSGLNKAGQPIASFFFLGPTGTGKTELAKSLAEFMFQDENSIIRFDMSEFKEEHSAALLYGAPPGYVGYEEGGMLVNKIRQQPYSIVLFDEIEKAHPSVFDIFLQILDEGKMHDRLGKVGDFSNAVILFTSNIGAENIIKSFEEGIIPKSENLMEIMANYFRPEFLARITEIVPFAPVSRENVLKIFNIHLKPLEKQLAAQGIEFSLSLEAKSYLADLGFSPRYGVRPLKSVIRTSLRKPLSRMIVKEEIKKGDKITADVQNNEDELSLKWKINQ